MYGAIIGDMVGFPYEYKHEDLTDREIPLFRKKGSASGSGSAEALAGEDFSDKTVMTAAMEAGLLQFERILPSIFARNTAGANASGAGAADANASGNASDADTGANAAGAGAQGASDSSEGADNTGGKISVGGLNGQGAHIPQNAFEDNYKKEVTSALRRIGQKYPLAGYPMDLSIWLFREGAETVKVQDAGPAARVSPVAWVFQDDLYMMRHLARVQAGLTHRGKESVTAAEAAACAVFLAIHGSTKPYISGYLEREFGYKFPDEKEMREEILRAGDARMLTAGAGSDTGAAPGTSLPAMTVRAAMTAFLHGRDFEDVLRRAVSLGGNSADIAAIAGAVAEAFFGIPQELKDSCMQRLPAELREAAEAFDARNEQKKRVREGNPAAKERWEKALTRATTRHPAAVQGNESLEQAIDQMRAKRDQQTFIVALEALRMRMNRKGRVFVPLVSAKRAEPAGTADAGAAAAAGRSGEEGGSPSKSSENTMIYSMQVIRTKDGKLWQPAYTSRAQLDKANAAMAKAKAENPAVPDQSSSMVLSYAMDALFKRFLPVGSTGAEAASETADTDGQEHPSVKEIIPPEIQGIVLNPYDKSFFLPRKTIEAIFIINRQAAQADSGKNNGN